MVVYAVNGGKFLSPSTSSASILARARNSKQAIKLSYTFVAEKGTDE